jgi:hypothetical protein
MTSSDQRMTLTIGDLLQSRGRERCIGRGAALAALQTLLSDERPLVAALHGLGGVGKTCLARAFADHAETQGARVLWLDGQLIEPSPRGFVDELARQLGVAPAGLPELLALLSAATTRTLIVLDTCERCRLLDAWLRQDFVPRLGLHMRLLLVGRDPPVSPWHMAPGWHGLFASHELGPLAADDALALLQAEGLGPQQAAQALGFAHGHPLALKLASGVLRARPGQLLEPSDLLGVVETLVGLYLAEVVDAPLRQALQRASVVRRVTVSLLKALLPQADAAATFERLSALSITTLAVDGLLLHDVVREAIAAHYRSVDPAGCLDARRAAWRQLQAESRDAPSSELWRYTADMLYMVQAPAVREVFFPAGSQPMAVESAGAADLQDILAIARQHDGDPGAQRIAHWWAHLPASFRLTRSAGNQVTGFYCLAEAADIPKALERQDPLVARWRQHVRSAGLASGDRVLFMRRVLADAESPQPLEIEAALMLDIKRAYLELRPKLRRLYTYLRQVTALDPFLRQAGFEFAPEIDVELEGVRHVGLILDFGPQSVDGWLSRLVASTLGLPEETQAPLRLDEAARELLVDGQRVALTAREFELLAYLMQREGQAVKRGDLLDDIWGTHYEGGSNVIDALVLGLRRKLGARAAAIETVVRFGYRFRQP